MTLSSIEAKSFLRSKTLWFNVLTLGLDLLQRMGELQILPTQRSRRSGWGDREFGPQGPGCPGRCSLPSA